MKPWKIVLSIFGIIVILLALDFGFGYVGVFKTKTVGKAQQNAEREVFMETQSFVEGKIQELTKVRKEYLLARDDETRAILCNTVSHSFALFNIEKLPDQDLKDFLKCMRDGTRYRIK